MSKFSDEHLEYLKKKKKEKLLIILIRFMIVITFLITWELLSNFSIINPFLYSSPVKIINTIIKLFKDGLLFKHTIITINEVLISFCLSSIIGILISTILWNSTFLYKIVDPYITIINSLPKVALGPLIIIWFGANIYSIIFTAFTITVFTTIINVYNGFNSVLDNYILVLKSFGANKKQIFFKLIFPINITNIISTLKINISLSLIGVIMGELLVSKEGLGYLIMYGSQVFQLDLVMTSVFLLGIISFLLYYLIDILRVVCFKKYYID